MLLSEHEARQVLQAYQSRVHAAVPRPRGLELWDEYYLNRVPQEEIERILRMPGSDLTWYELLIVSSAAFDETLYYLPFVFAYMANRRDGYSECSLKVAMFVKTHADDLHTVGLLGDTFDCLESVFGVWLSEFGVLDASKVHSLPCQVRLEALVEHGDDRDGFLATLMEHDVRDDTRGYVGAHILRSWCYDVSSETASAHFLDMCAKAVGPTLIRPPALYNDSQVQCVAQQADVINKHLLMAQPVWDQRAVPEWYVSEVRRRLGAPRATP